MSTITPAQQMLLDEQFRYHAPKPGQPERYERLRAAGKQLATVLLEVTPAGPDQSAALRKIREAVFTGNAAIALEEYPSL